ncbi:NAD-dependent epimerase/dehydratase family protein [Robertkochia aurantiaca]|uniref:NAD-dependent epimerase/dehydratase family protein n=1 Tax=Robertkochia aurantiaca TaxID=2873700 RepID=UPI001CCEB4DE|nr:NAD-dependent epimerase/dehydratase family protein [Robertkochia sp. 3YJGBD-33]
MTKVLVTGAGGQLGRELTAALAELYGNDQVIPTDINENAASLYEGFNFEVLDVMDAEKMAQLAETYEITQIYHLAAILSATGEQKPLLTWDLNMKSLLNVLELAKNKKLDKVYWPSSIAVFGTHTPMENTPQHCVMDPTTVYGISKLAGERWCEYYNKKFGVDVRSLRYPGLIGYKSAAGGGTTDYAVDIYRSALKGEVFECFLKENTYLPMMYMPDAIKATLELMQAPAADISIRSSYNVAALSFSPKEIAESIKKYHPDFEIRYKPDFRQDIADSWPDSIDDTTARLDWGWQPDYGLDAMTEDILKNLQVSVS